MIASLVRHYEAPEFSGRSGRVKRKGRLRSIAATLLMLLGGVFLALLVLTAVAGGFGDPSDLFGTAFGRSLREPDTDPFAPPNPYDRRDHDPLRALDVPPYPAAGNR